MKASIRIAPVAVLVALLAAGDGCSRPTPTAADAATTATAPASAPASAPSAAPQGVRGTVVRLAGNHMPGPRPTAGTRTPLAVPVHVFRGSVHPFDGPAVSHPAYVTTVRADANGDYQVLLPPATYTVVAEIDGKLYLNAFDGRGNWFAVAVTPGKWTSWNIAETSKAAF